METGMRETLYALLLLTFLLGACSSDIPATESFVAPTSTSTALSTATAVATATVSKATETAVPKHEAVFNEIENKVMARVLSTETFVPASVGMSLLAGGEAETGVDSRARLDFLPENTIVRLGPNSFLTISKPDAEDNKPQTTIEFFFGKIFILLTTGSFQVDTPTGVATVRGSLLSVEYDPEENLLIASCLEGHCALENKDGKKIELIAGEFSYIKDGSAPFLPERIGREEIREWLSQVPELADFLDILPDPNDYPDTNLRDRLRDAGGRPGDGDKRRDDGGLPRGG